MSPVHTEFNVGGSTANVNAKQINFSDGTVQTTAAIGVGGVSQAELDNIVNQLAAVGVFVDPNQVTPPQGGSPPIPSVKMDQGEF